MASKSQMKISVRTLAEYACSSGDLYAEGQGAFVASLSRMQEGTRLHKALQNRGIDGFEKEVYVQCTLEFNDFYLRIQGRIDGTYIENGVHVVEEIKSFISPPKSYEQIPPAYMAQAHIYAYLYALKQGLKTVDVRMICALAGTDKYFPFTENKNFDALQAEFYGYVEQYGKLAAVLVSRMNERNKSLQSLAFPYETPREGQADFIAHTASAISQKTPLFCEAPTGIGKTVCALYPALSAMGQGEISRVFYLTARTPVRKVAEDSLQDFRKMGATVYSITLFAKEKGCPMGACNPPDCAYQKGYYDRLKKAREEALSFQNLTREVLLEMAEKYKICPHEFSIEMSGFADVVIGDYNHVFDPIVSVKRLLYDKQRPFALLVDEAHNLIDRAREMFSAQLTRADFEQIKTCVPAQDPLRAVAGEAVKWFDGAINTLKEEGKQADLLEHVPTRFIEILQPLALALEMAIVQTVTPETQELLQDVYYKIRRFLEVNEWVDRRYEICFEVQNARLWLFCVHPAHRLQEVLDMAQSAVFFSATLSPVTYYQKMLCDVEAEALSLPSPFPSENFLVLQNTAVSTTFTKRKSTFDQVAACIVSALSGREGNYLVFFPSYAYLKEVHARVQYLAPHLDILVQQGSMSEKHRKAFLHRFEQSHTTLAAFAVMGGIFSEGIDLPGERLIGAIVVGVGLPQLSLEREMIRHALSRDEQDGYAFAYTFPGFVRVLQAAGRVIRTPDDRGILLLIDERLAQPPYTDLLPSHWSPIVNVQNAKEIGERVEGFWGE